MTIGAGSTPRLRLGNDAKKYADTVGWGFARFLGPTLKPYGEGKTFAQECVGCHVPVVANDFVFTSLAPRPR